MSRYDAYLSSSFRSADANPLMGYIHAIDNLYNNVHGGARYVMSQLPFTGKLRRFRDEVQKWDDSYSNTGRDPTYSTTYGNGGIPFVNDAIGALMKPARMVSSLSKMYGAEIELNIAKERHATARNKK